MRLFYLWCRVCEPEQTPDNVLPFSSPAERGRWAAGHTRGTGHDRWLVIDEPEQPARAAVQGDAATRQD